MARFLPAIAAFAGVSLTGLVLYPVLARDLDGFEFTDPLDLVREHVGALRVSVVGADEARRRDARDGLDPPLLEGPLALQTRLASQHAHALQRAHVAQHRLRERLRGAARLGLGAPSPLRARALHGLHAGPVAGAQPAFNGVLDAAVDLVGDVRRPELILVMVDVASAHLHRHDPARGD